MEFLKPSLLCSGGRHPPNLYKNETKRILVKASSLYTGTPYSSVGKTQGAPSPGKRQSLQRILGLCQGLKPSER